MNNENTKKLKDFRTVIVSAVFYLIKAIAM